MISEEFKSKIEEWHLKAYISPEICNSDPITVLLWEFVNIYNACPKLYSYSATTNKNPLSAYAKHEEQYDTFDSIRNVMDTLKGEYYLYGEALYFENCVVTDDYIIYIEDDIPESIKSCLVIEEITNRFLYASVSNGQFITRTFPVKKVDKDILNNYNDDLPVDKFTEFVEMDKSGIAILHGIPGTGKTYFIRYLIAKYPDKSFIWFDQSLLTQATSDAFVQFIISNKNSILILEDCEILIKSRNEGSNGLLNTVLNIADGIIGDCLNIKFICTFNTDITNVDKALLRKGRLKIKYEFKELETPKVKALFDKLNIKDSPKKMPLCDIFNYEEQNGGEEKRVKIGF